MSPTPPTLLPFNTATSYTSAFDPTSPKTYHQASRTPSPPRNRRVSINKPYFPKDLQKPARSIKVPHALSFLLTPRVISPIILWTLAIYLIHSYLLPLPLPKLRIPAIRPQGPKAEQHFLSSSFPQPPLREGDDSLDSLDPRYRPFSPLPAADAPFPRLRPTRFLPPRCLEQWFADGETTCGAGELGEEEKLDATWLWVNGSDTRWRNSMVHWRQVEKVYSPEHHFREQDELRHSMRSVLDSLPGHIRTCHLIVADYPFEPEDLALLPNETITKLDGKRGKSEEISSEFADRLTSHWRVAQTPTWLDFSRRDPAAPDHPYHSGNYPTLRYAGHSEIFHLPTMDRNAVTEGLGEREWKEREWRKQALPSFNSMAIESRVGWLQGLADVTLSLNDDFFLLEPHAVADFHSPLYGSVIRFDHGYLQQVRPILDKTRFNDAGEVGGLYHANYILSQRYPRRLRPYFAHVPKVITRGLHHEASLMFKEALTDSSKRRFREMVTGEGDIQMQWLLTSLRVERWREALLWTYVVANLGRSGRWGDNGRMELMDMFGLGEEDDDVVKIEVHRGDRWTLERGRMSRVFEQAGWEPPKVTEFLFSSLDGHMPPLLKNGVSPTQNDKCLLDLDRCFGSFWTRGEEMPAADMFKRLTFQYPECGDCLIMALVTASGPLGLSAFFPPKDAVFVTAPLVAGKPFPKYLPPPHLPLTATWHEADFSLDNVMAATALPDETVNLREYSMKLLSRYVYLSAKSVSHFHMLKSPEHANRVFKMIQDNNQVSVLGLNDDIETDYDEVKEIMNRWFEFRWPRRAVWERDWDPIKDKLPT